MTRPAKAIANQPAKIDVLKALELRVKHGMSFPQIAKQLGCSHQAVQERLKRFKHIIEDPESLRAFNSFEDVIQGAIKERYSAHLLQADLEKCSPRDAAIVYGTMYDKHRLQTGQSTSNAAIVLADAALFALEDQDTTPQHIVIDAEVVADAHQASPTNKRK